MSDRERWVIYPLLFLALGSAVVDKIIPSDAKFNKIEAQEIAVNELTSGQIECRQLKGGELEAAKLEVQAIVARQWIGVDNQGRLYPIQPLRAAVRRVVPAAEAKENDGAPEQQEAPEEPTKTEATDGGSPQNSE